MSVKIATGFGIEDVESPVNALQGLYWRRPRGTVESNCALNTDFLVAYYILSVSEAATVHARMTASNYSKCAAHSGMSVIQYGTMVVDTYQSILRPKSDVLRGIMHVTYSSSFIIGYSVLELWLDPV